MQIESISPIAAILVGIVSGIMVITDDGTVKIGLLFLQYLLSAILLTVAASLQLSVIKMVAAVTVCLTFLITLKQIGDREIGGGGEIPSGKPFRMIAVLLVATSAIGIGRSELVAIPDITPEGVSAALLIGGMGLLQVSLLEDPINVAVGIISLLNGFEIVYAVLEDALAVMALLALVHISLAVVIGIIEIDVEENHTRVIDL